MGHSYMGLVAQQPDRYNTLFLVVQDRCCISQFPLGRSRNYCGPRGGIFSIKSLFFLLFFLDGREERSFLLLITLPRIKYYINCMKMHPTSVERYSLHIASLMPYHDLCHNCLLKIARNRT